MVGVNRFSYKSKDRVRNEKVYVVDTAFVTEREDNFSLENLGWKLENIVCIELMRRYKPLFVMFSTIRKHLRKLILL